MGAFGDARRGRGAFPGGPLTGQNATWGRGLYLLLALLLEPEQAKALRDMLVEHAAETRDHSVSDDFVTLLKKRQGAEKARGARSRGVV